MEQWIRNRILGCILGIIGSDLLGGEDLEKDGGRGAAVVGRTFLGGSGVTLPRNFEPSESGSEAF